MTSQPDSGSDSGTRDGLIERLRSALSRADEHLHSWVRLHPEDCTAETDAIFRENADLFASPTPAWLPVESAPKDGTRFIGLRGQKAYMTEHGKLYVKLPHEDGGPIYRDVWNRVTPGQIAPWEPTHWQPLPPPPSLIGGNHE